MIKRAKIDQYVNLIRVVKSIELTKSFTFSVWIIKQDAQFTIDLIENQRRDLAMMREDYKKNLRTYRERIDALKILNTFVLISMNRTNLIYLRDKTMIFQKLLALKKRLASINRIRELEIDRKYKNLLRVSKHQQLNDWLLNSEKVYAEAVRLNLSNVQDHRCLYNFLNALRIVDVTFVIDRKAILT